MAEDLSAKKTPEFGHKASQERRSYWKQVEQCSRNKNLNMHFEEKLAFKYIFKISG